MRPLLILFCFFFSHQLFAQQYKPVDIPFSAKDFLSVHCQEDKNGSLLILAEESELYRLFIIDSNGKYQSIVDFGKIYSEREKKAYVGIVQDEQKFYVLFKYEDYRYMLDAVIVDKSTYKRSQISSVDMTNNEKDALLTSVIVNNKLYVLSRNKKENTFEFIQFTPTPDSIASITIPFQGGENDFKILKDEYFAVNSHLYNSVHDAHYDNKVYDKGNNTILITAENNKANELKENTYFLEFNFNTKTIKRKDFLTGISSYQVRNHQLFANKTSATNSYILGNSFYKTWLNRDSFFVNVYNIDNWTLTNEISISSADLIYYMATDFYSPRVTTDAWGFGGVFNNNESSRLTNISYILKEFKKGSLVITVNKTDSDTIALQLGAYVPEYSSSPGYFSANGMMRGGGSYISGYHTSYFTLLLHSERIVRGRHNKNGYDLIQDYVNNRKEQENKSEQEETNNFLKVNDISVRKFINAEKGYCYSGDNKYMLVFGIKKKLFRVSL